MISSCAFFASVLPAALQHVAYVDIDAPPGGDGTSWAAAFDDLQAALASLAPGSGVTEVWVAEGVYRPAPAGGPTSASFELVEGVRVYGGFDGTEASLDQRDWNAHECVLSGDLNANDLPGAEHGHPSLLDNCTQVVSARRTTAAAWLDGFTLLAAHAPVTASGALVILDGGLRVNHCELRENSSAGTGAAVSIRHEQTPPAVLGMEPSFFNDCFFFRNRALTGGGAVHTHYPTEFRDCRFEANVCAWSGGAVSDTRGRATGVACTFTANSADAGGAVFTADQVTGDDSGPRWTHCRFIANVATGYGGAIAVSHGVDAVVSNSLFLGNRAWRAGGLHVFTTAGTTGARVHGCTLFANRATDSCGGLNVALFGEGELTVTNSLLWGNTDADGDGESAQIRAQHGPGEMRVDSCGVQGWTGDYDGFATFGFDPLFVDAQGADGVPGTFDDDLRLRNTSPYRDMGSNDLVVADVGDVDEDGDVLEPLPLDLDGLARLHDDPFRLGFGTQPGAVVDLGVYETPTSDPGCLTERFCATAPNSVGPGAHIWCFGSPSVVQNDFTLFAGPIDAFELGLFYYGSVPIQLPFGDGFRCIGGASVFRLGPLIPSDETGYAARLVDFDVPPAGAGPGLIQPGTTWYYQFWYRDLAGPGGTGFNLSDGASATLCP